MKILLVYPALGITEFGWTKKLPGFNGELHWIHHGLALIGAYAKSKGHQVELIDLRTLNSWEEYISLVYRKNPDVVGVSISFMDLFPALKAVDYIKEIDSNIKVIVGGFLPSLFPEKFTYNENIDYVVVGEGELAFLDIIENKPKNKLVYGERPDIDSMPFADRELFEYERELICPFSDEQPIPMITMVAGRACPYNCTFCQPAEKKLYGKGIRMRSPQNVIRELKDLKRYGFRSITFWDDTFTLNKKWVFDFCDLYEKDFTAEITANSRADTICNNEDMVKRLAEAGLKWCLIGFESGSQRILNFLKKGTTLEQNHKAIEICRKYGIKINGTFMIGLPTETKEEQVATINFIKEVRPEHFSLFYFTPIPATEIYEFCENNNLMLRDNPFDIQRSVDFRPKIRGVDYKFLEELRNSV